MNRGRFTGKKIILGVTGGIAAYKACRLLRLLVSEGADVRVVMTPSATEFVAPLTFSVLSGNEVLINIFPESQKNGVKHGTWHIEYALWADLMIIAPATNNTIAKIANGFADNALTTLASALRCPLLVAPAADMDMYANKANSANIKALEERGVFIVKAESGFLASGLEGQGRMASEEKIADAAEIILSGFRSDLTGLRILVTAGPTYEDIDPVRFIGNRSSGKMGYEIAEAAFLRGAEVTLISGPVTQVIYPEVNLKKVRSAEEMFESVKEYLPQNGVLIMSAAVADFRPKKKELKKIKKESGTNSIELEENPDILASVEKAGKYIAGFALETDNAVENAIKKLKAKGIDLIVLNSLEEPGAGFEEDTNKVKIIRDIDCIKEYPLMSKFLTANYILSEIKKSICEKENN